MFWRFGGYANISTIDTILEKENFQLEDLLDESDLIQELKSHNAKLVEYLRDQQVLEKLLEYVVAPKLEPVASGGETNEEEEDDAKGKGISLPFSRPRASSRATDGGSDDGAIEKKRNRYAFIAAEILSSDNWSIYEALMESRSLLRNFWQFLKRPTPLDPLQASYFTKVNESLFDKKTEDMLDLLKSLDGAIPDMLKHVDCPNIMDLLLRIISLERTESGQGIVEWLYTQDVIPTLLSFLAPEHSWGTQTSAGDFLKAIITVSANASQNEQTCIGPNELTRQLVSKPCVEQLIKYMLGGGNPLTCGVGIIIEVIRKNNSDYDPDGAEPNSVPSSRDPIYLGTLLRLFAQHIPDFMNLMKTPSKKPPVPSTSGQKDEGLGFDRFKTCELMAELLHCSNMGLLNEAGAEEVIAGRDLQRQRMREEGRLVAMRGEDAPSSAEDLTMRMSNSSPAEEVRRLEVMNVSDDDGFEEVTHAADEDSSHGVEELPEVPVPGPTSSFLDKDDDDFVDEPLSSPRLNVREIEIRSEEEKQELDEQDLAVPHLSPTKKAAESSIAPKEVRVDEPVDGQAGFAHEESRPQVETPAAAQVPSSGAQKKEEPKTDTQTEATPVTQAASETEAPRVAQVTVTPVEEKPQPMEGMSPHPEDTPAPLFSSQNPAPSPVATEEATSAESKPTICGEQPPIGRGASEETPVPDTEASRPERTDVSIVVNQESEPTTPIDDSPINFRPVVGDYLKMQFVDHRVVPTILDFFFKYRWNNFLHNVVYDIVQQVFNGPMDRGYNPALATSLFEAADITNLIINGQLASEKSQAESKTRLGYMGHLTLIAEEVVKFTERHPPELLSETVLQKVMAQDWVNYVEGPLAETRERDNAILGGVRPEVAMSNRAMNASGLAGVGLSGLGSLGLGGGGGSNALAEAGLNGGQDLSENTGSSGIGPFAISSGTLMSGFGSSSDEDDDEEQDNDEDVANEFRAYTDPLNANSSGSMHPPSIPPPPPPPPPLNIPPSRARLQLAARLAMNKRNAAAAAANGDQEGSSTSSDNTTGSGTFSLPNTSASDRLRNPFADDDDEDEEDDHRREIGSGSGSGSDDDDDGEVGHDRESGSGGGGSSGWNRGSWWRGMVRRGGNSRNKDADKSGGAETERFGDGRDDSEDSDDGVEEEDVIDEEFGDFAMPEVEAGSRSSAVSSSSGGGGMVTGIDPTREKTLLKPLPIHPSSSSAAGNSTGKGGASSGSGPFGSLWPFSSTKDKDATASTGSEDSAASPSETQSAAQAQAATPPVDETITEEPVELGEDEEGNTVVGEDGHKINRAVEAKRRTSIEDPDDDDDNDNNNNEEKVGGDEIIVGRPPRGTSSPSAAAGAR